MSEVVVARRNPERSMPDVAARRLLHIPDVQQPRSRDVHGPFSTSMVLSGLRCLLSYVVLPVLSPVLGVATTIGPIVGIPIGLLALVFDVRAIRRFWLANHRWRWAMTWLYLAVMALVVSLVVEDIVHLVT